MSVFSVYDRASGLFTGLQMSGAADFLVANTPGGCGLVEGRWDHELWCVDPQSGEVKARPADAAPALARARLALLERLHADIAELEARKARPMGALVLANALAMQPSQDDLQHLAAIENRLNLARGALQQARSAQTLEALQAVAWPPSGG